MPCVRNFRKDSKERFENFRGIHSRLAKLGSTVLISLLEHISLISTEHILRSIEHISFFILFYSEKQDNGFCNLLVLEVKCTVLFFYREIKSATLRKVFKSVSKRTKTTG